jgi:hypothetical protein
MPRGFAGRLKGVQRDVIIIAPDVFPRIASGAGKPDAARCAEADVYRHTAAAEARFSDSARP